MRSTALATIGALLLSAAGAPGCNTDGAGADGSDGGAGDAGGGGGGGNGSIPAPRSCPAPAMMPCTHDGWCNEYPGVFSGLWSISALAPDDAWMSGFGGTAIHVECDRWTWAALPVFTAFSQVHAAAADAVWLFGQRGFAGRFDGA